MKILIVEDEARIAHYLKKGLELKSYTVDVAEDGDLGMSQAMYEDYDLLILDWMLPSKDGLKVCQELREAGKKMPILMLTAKGQLEDKVAGLDSGADDYLAKPFEFEELLARVRSLLRRPPLQSNGVLLVGDLQINTNSYQVSRNGHEINLTRKEYALLEHLARNAGQVFSKEKLMDQIWSYDDEVTANAVQVYVGYLRNKIDRPFTNSPVLIKTVRGFGYKLESPKKLSSQKSADQFEQEESAEKKTDKRKL